MIMCLWFRLEVRRIAEIHKLRLGFSTFSYQNSGIFPVCSLNLRVGLLVEFRPQFKFSFCPQPFWGYSKLLGMRVFFWHQMSTSNLWSIPTMDGSWHCKWLFWIQFWIFPILHQSTLEFLFPGLFWRAPIQSAFRRGRAHNSRHRSFDRTAEDEDKFKVLHKI